MSEEDLCDLLKFDRKMLRQRINTLRADKFIQARMKMVTLEDNKTQKEQYYFINYKVKQVILTCNVQEQGDVWERVQYKAEVQVKWWKN